MIAVSQVDIRKTLDRELLGLLPSLGLNEDDVAWKNKAFKPKTKREYLRPVQLPAESRQATLGSDGYLRLSGVYQIGIVGVKDVGSSRMEELADLIVGAFAAGRVLDCCGLDLTISMSYKNPDQEDENRPMTPISILYYCHTPQKQ